MGHGFISESRFLRTLAMVSLVPTQQQQRSALLDYFRAGAGSDLMDYRAFLAALDEGADAE